MTWYQWIVLVLFVYELLRYLALIETVAVEDFDFKWGWWFICGFIGHRLVKKESGMYAYCRHCRKPEFSPDYRF